MVRFMWVVFTYLLLRTRGEFGTGRDDTVMLDVEIGMYNTREFTVPTAREMRLQLVVVEAE